ncbi:MAG: hypothetical protein P4L53_07740 [Candidatus Obscuribacterales bacterium]|nr:hypothetical protein [Candidatus Obscuribacterales bacterium]
MNIFAFFKEEQQDIEEKLKYVTENYGHLSREEVFDKVKYIGDAVTGHLKKQHKLLLSHVEKNEKVQPFLDACQKDASILKEELGQLVMVHVDEPEYEKCLKRLLLIFEDHIKFSNKMYEKLKDFLSEQDVVEMNEELNVMVHHASDFNTLQP